jgi:hypothetical protein
LCLLLVFFAVGDFISGREGGVGSMRVSFGRIGSGGVGDRGVSDGGVGGRGFGGRGVGGGSFSLAGGVGDRNIRTIRISVHQGDGSGGKASLTASTPTAASPSHGLLLPLRW